VLIKLIRAEYQSERFRYAQKAAVWNDAVKIQVSKAGLAELFIDGRSAKLKPRILIARMISCHE
jgi:hypothetical protein